MPHPHASVTFSDASAKSTPRFFWWRTVVLVVRFDVSAKKLLGNQIERSFVLIIG